MKLIKYLVILSLPLITFISCQREISPAYPNNAPNTVITNVPVQNDTLFPVVTLTWDGEDDDGYIIGCEYKYVTYHLSEGDSSIHDWIFTEDEEITIVLESSDLLNRQYIYFRAVDNDGAVDETPAKLVVYTPRTIFPDTKIIKPVIKTYFYLEEITDWWHGIPLNFTGNDPDGKILEFGWAVDDTNWIWTKDTSIVIGLEYFDSPLNGEHIIRVTSKDNTNLVDPIGDSLVINLVYPTFEKDILIIDETFEDEFPNKLNFSDSQVDSFYSELFEGSDSWDYQKNGMPPADTLGKYKLLVWHADNRPKALPHNIVNNVQVLSDYMNVGGNLLVSGWRVVKSFAWEEGFPTTFEKGTFIHDYLHIVAADETPYYVPPTGREGFRGGYGQSGYSDIMVDSVKIDNYSKPDPPVLSQINTIQRGGFTKNLFSYRNRGADNQFVGCSCGLIYYGTSFKVVTLGFPLFFIEKDDAKEFINKVLIELEIE